MLLADTELFLEHVDCLLSIDMSTLARVFDLLSLALRLYGTAELDLRSDLVDFGPLERPRGLFTH